MIRRYNDHKLQTNPWHREEEPHNNHETQGRQTKQSNQLPLFKMIAKLEWTQSNVQQNTEQLKNSTMGITKTTTNQQQQNHRLRTDSSPSHWGGGGA